VLDDPGLSRVGAHAPIFIVGCSRAGTTVCQSILSQSSDLVGFPEANLLYLLAGDLDARRFGAGRRQVIHGVLRRINECGFQIGRSRQIRQRMRRLLKTVGRPELIPQIPRSVFRIQTIFSAFSQIMNAASDGRRWIEKSPQNVFILDVITRYLPDAQFVHVIRDERDNIASLRDAALRFPNFSRRFGGTDGLARAVAFWNQAVLCSAAWRGLPNHVFLRYEDLCRDPETTMRSVCDELRVRFTPDMLGYRTEGIVRPRETWKESSVEIRQSASKFGTLFTPEEQQYVIAQSLKADALFPLRLAS
jgi:hypothetical protein